MDASSLTEGVDSIYHVQTNVSVEEGLLFEALAYIVYKKKRYYLSLVCTCKKASNNQFEVYVEVQNGALSFSGKRFDNRCASFIQFMLSSIIVIW